MASYILRRIITIIITLFFISVITFWIMHSVPGGPFTGEKKLPAEVEAVLNEKYGLNDPLPVQYINYMKNIIFHGDLGVSFKKTGVTVNELISGGFPNSARIGLWATLFIVLVGVPAGILAALKQNKITDRVLMIIATLGVTIPSFVLATLFLYIFSRTLGWVPSYGTPNWKGFIGPVVTIAGFSLAFIIRLTRSSMLEVINSDYIKTARSKGLSEPQVIFKHALRNALIPVVTYLGPMIAGIVTGSFVIEKVFAINGLGSLFVSYISNRDYTVIMGITLFYSVLLVLSIFVVDLLYVLIDPRIKYD